MTGRAQRQAVETAVAARALIPQRLRRWALAVALLAAALFAGMSAYYTDHSAPGRMDTASYDALAGCPAWLAHLLADIGGPEPVTLATVLIVVLLVLQHRPRGVALAVLTPTASSVFTEWVIKPLVHRTYGGTLAFPSGHASGAWSVALVIVVLVLRSRLRETAKIAVSLAAFVIAAAACIGLVADDYHYLTDTIGSAVLCVAVVLGLSLLIDVFADARARRRSRRPIAPPKD
jgi:undecaprenyl-diphosphatase